MSSQPAAEPWEHRFVETNGIRLHCVVAGSGPLVVLLHGFPQFWYAWRHQIPALATRFTVVAPDLRGYNDSDKPKRVRDYKVETLADDVVGLIHALGAKKGHVVGHDWGGAVAYQVAMDHPEVVERFAILNCPHPDKLKRALRTSLTQLKRSWYMFVFQIPWLPEKIMLRDHVKEFWPAFRGWSIRKESFSDDDIRKFQDAFLKPGAARAAINYYRAAGRGSLKRQTFPKIAAPTLVIWAEKDRALGKELTHGMDAYFSGLFRIHYVPDCSHWVNEEQPELVNRLLLEHLG